MHELNRRHVVKEVQIPRADSQQVRRHDRAAHQGKRVVSEAGSGSRDRPARRPNTRGATSTQKIGFKPWGVRSKFTSRNSGVARYWPNSLAQALSDSGGSAPTSGCHWTIDSPECVSRVMPPTTSTAYTS